MLLKDAHARFELFDVEPDFVDRGTDMPQVFEDEVVSLLAHGLILF